VAVHEVGHLLAMAHTPMNNLRINNNVELLENPAVSMRDTTGELNVVGVTPAMFPAYFLTQDQTGFKFGGSGDLSPDDVAGLTYLYPRENGLEQFFTISSIARTQSRPGSLRRQSQAAILLPGRTRTITRARRGCRLSAPSRGCTNRATN